MSLTQYSDSGSRTIVRHDGKGRPLETRRPGSAWQARLQLAAYSTNAADEMTNHYDRYDFLDACTEEIDSGSLLSHLRGNPSHSTGRLTGIEQRASNGEPLLTTFAYDALGRIVRKGTVGLGGHLIVCDITYNFVGDVTDERCREYEPDGNAYTKVLDAHIEKKYELPHTKLLSSYVITIESGGVTDAETVMCPDYDDFGNVIGIDRGGAASYDVAPSVFISSE